MRQPTVTVKISKKNFASGLVFVKRYGGKINPDKTWELPANCPIMDDLEAYYLIRVDKPEVVEEWESDEPADW